MFCVRFNLNTHELKWRQERLWDLATGKQVTLDVVRRAMYLPDGKRLAIHDINNKNIRICDAKTGRELVLPAIPFPYDGWFVPIPESNLLGVATGSDVEAGPLFNWCRTYLGVNWLANEDENVAVQFWNSETSEMVGKIERKIDVQDAMDVQISTDGKTLAWKRFEKEIPIIELWDIPPRKPLRWVLGLLAIPSVATLITLWRWRQARLRLHRTQLQ